MEWRGPQHFRKKIVTKWRTPLGVARAPERNIVFRNEWNR